MHQNQDRLRRFAERFTLKPENSAKSITLVSVALLLAFLACAPTTPTQEAPPLQQVETTEAPQVAQAPTNTPTPTAAPYIEGSVVRAAFDPAAGLGAPDVHDDFSGTNPEFELNNASGVAHGWYQNGRFNITFPTRGWWTWYSGSTTLTNFYADVVVYNGDRCVERDAGGMLYRYYQPVDFGLLFGITCGGGYFVGITGGPGPAGVVCYLLDPALAGPSAVDCTGMWNHPTSQYIDPGPGAANRIGVRAVGQSIMLYINGHQVDSLNLPAGFTYNGKFALYLGAGQADYASVSFDDLSIWSNP